MKVEGRLFAAGVVFYGIAAAAYWFLSREPAGTTAILLTGGLAFLVAFYTFYTGRRTGDRPEDRFDAEVADEAGELGFFSPQSWWPLPLALGGAVIALGLIFAYWLMAVGIGLLGFAVLGFVFEYYRGDFAH